MTTLHSRSMSDTVAQSGTSMPFPKPRGPVSDLLFSILRADVADAEPFVAAARSLVSSARDSPRAFLVDEDAQICLTALYELHLQGITGVGDVTDRGVERNLERRPAPTTWWRHCGR